MSQEIKLLPVTIHTDNSKPAFSDDRLVVIRWKVTKENPKPHAAVCISVPQQQIICEPAVLQRSLVLAYQELQDKLVRNIIESNADKLQSIEATRVTSEAVAAFAEEEATSKRLSGDSIAAMFDAYISDILLVTLADKSGITSDQLASNPQLSTQLANNVESAKKMLVSLASPRSIYPATTLQQLLKVLKLATEPHEIITTLTDKLTLMMKPKEEVLAFSL